MCLECCRSDFLNGRLQRLRLCPRLFPDAGMAIPVCIPSPYWWSSTHRRFLPYAFILPAPFHCICGWRQGWSPAPPRPRRCFQVPAAFHSQGIWMSFHPPARLPASRSKTARTWGIPAFSCPCFSFRIRLLSQRRLPAAEHPPRGRTAPAPIPVLQAEIPPVEPPHDVGAGAAVLPVRHQEAGIPRLPPARKSLRPRRAVGIRPFQERLVKPEAAVALPAGLHVGFAR